eukprot:1377107-Amorphochlora_amoeboformis.AAC.1
MEGWPFWRVARHPTVTPSLPAVIGWRFRGDSQKCVEILFPGDPTNMRDIIVLIGPPGAGKDGGTSIVHGELPIVTHGQMLRAAVKAGTTIGKQAQGLMAKGKLVPDEIVARLVKERTEQREPSEAAGQDPGRKQ